MWSPPAFLDQLFSLRVLAGMQLSDAQGIFEQNLTDPHWVALRTGEPLRPGEESNITYHYLYDIDLFYQAFLY